MKILALETSTEACSVALWQDGDVLERHEAENQHSERILPMVQEVLAESGYVLAQLDAIAFGRGPGSFTGLRIGAGVAQGLAFGADLAVLPVSSLAALAQAVEGSRILAAFDARMNQVYWGAYVRNAEGIVVLSGEEQLLFPKDIPAPVEGDWVGAGSGWDQYSEALMTRLAKRVSAWHAHGFPHARYTAGIGAYLYKEGAAVAPEQALPVYLRDEVAMKTRRG